MTDTADTTRATDAFRFRLSFFKLVVRDIDAIGDFYAAAFGFEVRNRIELPGIRETMLALPGEQFTLVLYQNTDGRPVTIGSGHGPIGLATRDIDGAYAHAVAAGAREERAPFDLPTARIAFLQDPEGHQIELIQFKRPA